MKVIIYLDKAKTAAQVISVKNSGKFKVPHDEFDPERKRTYDEYKALGGDMDLPHAVALGLDLHPRCYMIAVEGPNGIRTVHKNDRAAYSIKPNSFEIYRKSKKERKELNKIKSNHKKFILNA